MEPWLVTGALLSIPVVVHLLLLSRILSISYSDSSWRRQWRPECTDPHRLALVESSGPPLVVLNGWVRLDRTTRGAAARIAVRSEEHTS